MDLFEMLMEIVLLSRNATIVLLLLLQQQLSQQQQQHRSQLQRLQTGKIFATTRTTNLWILIISTKEDGVLLRFSLLQLMLPLSESTILVEVKKRTILELYSLLENIAEPIS